MPYPEERDSSSWIQMKTRDDFANKYRMVRGLRKLMALTEALQLRHKLTPILK